MERAQFDWKPVDWLNVRVGRWLTPYGIWNEDHGATVLISATQPFMVKHAFVPGAQTGLMVSGRGFPTDLLTLDYALTVSNGRGPMDEFYDLDSNKALGFRGRMSLRIGDADLSAGAYVYYGKYTDTTNLMKVYMNSTFSGFAEGMDDPVRYVETTTRQYREAVIAADLRLSFKGVSVFGEFVRGRVEYLKASQIDPIRPLMIGSSPTIPAAEANYIKQAGYVLGAWELPLSKFIGEVKIIPFAGVDFLSPHDVYDYDSLNMIQFGVNVKPAAYVSLKSNAYCVIPRGDTPIMSTVWYWTNQLAVSF